MQYGKSMIHEQR